MDAQADGTITVRDIREEIFGVARLVGRHWAIVSLWYVAVSYISLLHYAKSRGIIGWFGDGQAVITLIPFQVGAAIVVVSLLLFLALVPIVLFTFPEERYMIAFRSWLFSGTEKQSDPAYQRRRRLCFYCAFPLASGSVALALLDYIELGGLLFWLGALSVAFMPSVLFGLCAWRGIRKGGGSAVEVFAYAFYVLVANLIGIFLTLFVVELFSREPGGFNAGSERAVTILAVGIGYAVIHFGLLAYATRTAKVAPRMIAVTLIVVTSFAMVIPPVGALISGGGLFLMGSGGEAISDLRVVAEAESARAWVVEKQAAGPTALIGSKTVELRVAVLFDAGDRLLVRLCGTNSAMPVWIKREEILGGERTRKSCRLPQRTSNGGSVARTAT